MQGNIPGQGGIHGILLGLCTLMKSAASSLNVFTEGNPTSNPKPGEDGWNQAPAAAELQLLPGLLFPALAFQDFVFWMPQV